MCINLLQSGVGERLSLDGRRTVCEAQLSLAIYVLAIYVPEELCKFLSKQYKSKVVIRIIMKNKEPIMLPSSKNCFFFEKCLENNNLVFLWAIEGYFPWLLFMGPKDTYLCSHSHRHKNTQIQSQLWQGLNCFFFAQQPLTSTHKPVFDFLKPVKTRSVSTDILEPFFICYHLWNKAMFITLASFFVGNI